ncbi:unnamed protein product [Sphenostylis stenocarpa]|uniref:Pectinesterase inhibitor domain-containing protein n=1 Tax=Sphenostylis stenocarpa TaxID=92480 RepID=A0AA86SKC1_9FABA|nr:unnamed protein product [Sphenostylis stenocarpa]
MKHGINLIVTLFSVTLLLSFVLCTAAAEDPPSQTPNEKPPETPNEKPPKRPNKKRPETPNETPMESMSSKSPPLEPETPNEKPPKTPNKKRPETPNETPMESMSSKPPPLEAEPPAAEPPEAEPPAAVSPEAESPFGFQSTEFSNTEELMPNEEGSFEFGRGGGGRASRQWQMSPAFSSFFADIQKGSLRGSKTITMHNHIKKHERDSVKKVCSHTEYPDVCLSTVVPFLSRSFDLTHILEASIKACSFQTNFTISIVVKHMKSSPEMATALADCKRQYKNALKGLNKALRALHSHDLGNVTVMLGSVMADISSCESGFEGLKKTSGHIEGMASVTATHEPPATEDPPPETTPEIPLESTPNLPSEPPESTLTEAEPPEVEPPQAEWGEAEPPLGFPTTEYSNSEETTSNEEWHFGFGGGGRRARRDGHMSETFSSFFSDIQMGSLRGSKTITMHDHIKKHDRDSVKKVCSRTEYPDVCLSTIVPFLSRHFDLTHILEAAIKACSFQANFTISIVVRYMESSPEMATALAGCKRQYMNAFKSLHKALEALHSQDLGTVTVMLSSVMADVSSCESGFEGLKMTSRHTEGMVGITASNCVSIVALIRK